MRVLRALGLLAQASNLSDLCRLADTKRFQNDIKLLTLQVQVQQLDNAKVLPALTAALVKGLQLYVSTSTQHTSAKRRTPSTTSTRHLEQEAAAVAQASLSCKVSKSLLPLRACRSPWST